MKKVKRAWDLLSEAKREFLIGKTISFFKKERDEKIGVIAAEEILDFFLQNIASDIYTKGVEDSKQLLKKRFEDLEVDLDLIQSP